MLPAKAGLYCLGSCKELHFLICKQPKCCAQLCRHRAWQGSRQWCRKKTAQERKGKVLNPWWWPQRSVELRETQAQHWDTCCELVSKLWGPKCERPRETEIWKCQVFLYSNTVVISRALKDLCAKVGRSQKCFSPLFSYPHLKNTKTETIKSEKHMKV